MKFALGLFALLFTISFSASGAEPTKASEKKETREPSALRKNDADSIKLSTGAALAYEAGVGVGGITILKLTATKTCYFHESAVVCMDNGRLVVGGGAPVPPPPSGE